MIALSADEVEAVSARGALDDEAGRYLGPRWLAVRSHGERSHERIAHAYWWGSGRRRVRVDLEDGRFYVVAPDDRIFVRRRS
jgi:hypothetical protein